MTSSYLSRYLKNEKNALTPNKPGDTKLKTFYLDKEGNQVEKTISPPPTDKEDYPEDDRGAYKKGGKVGSASKRADGIAQRGKTRGRVV